MFFMKGFLRFLRVRHDVARTTLVFKLGLRMDQHFNNPLLPSHSDQQGPDHFLLQIAKILNT